MLLIIEYAHIAHTCKQHLCFTLPLPPPQTADIAGDPERSLPGVEGRSRRLCQVGHRGGVPNRHFHGDHQRQVGPELGEGMKVRLMQLCGWTQA